MRAGIPPTPAHEAISKQWVRVRFKPILLRHSPGNGSSAELLNRKRHVKNLKRDLIRKARLEKKQFSIPKRMLMARPKPSIFMDTILENRTKLWVPVLRRRRSVPIREITLKDFSFIDNPIGTLRLIREIALVEGSEISAYLHFDDDYCFDIGPYLVLSEMWSSMAPVFRGGRMLPPIQKVIWAVGLSAPLHMGLLGLRDLEDVWAFPLQRRRPPGSSNSLTRNLDPQAREKVVDRFIDEVDRWLGVGDDGLELTADGRAWIAHIIGEVLDNCERHSSPDTKDGDWSVAAFMARRVENGQPVFRCYMAFLSVGASIEESLRTCSATTREEVKRYSGRHFGQNGAPSTETLQTLFALQDGVTRDRNADSAGRGGTGLQDVIELVNILGTNSNPGRTPRLTIISGTSCIMLHGPYITGERKGGEHSARVIWCNPANSDMEPPDPAYVFDLPERFGGTLISLSFTFDPKHMIETVSG